MRRLLPLLALLCLLAQLRAQVDRLYDSSITLGAACRTAPTLVLAVISDRKVARDTDANGTRDFGVYPERSRREADVISYSDYDPGVYPERSRRGTTLPGRTGYNGSTNPNHRYGFQGEACPERSRRESDDELYGDGNAIAFTYRVHDPRIGRFLSVDPLAPEYPWNSPYAFSENSTIAFIELEGLERFFAVKSGKFLGKIGTSCEVRVCKDQTAWDESQKMKKAGKSTQEMLDYLNAYSKKAYEEHDANLLVTEWANEAKKLPNAHMWEYVTLAFAKEFTDEDQSAITLLVRGSTETDKKRSSVFPSQSYLVIDGLKIYGNHYGEFISYDFDEPGWRKYLVAHTHPAGTAPDDNASYSGPPNFSADDIGYSLEDKILSYIVPYSYTTIKRFDPNIYLRDTKIPFKRTYGYSKFSFDGNAISKSIVTFK